jgi:hypothetical protein
MKSAMLRMRETKYASNAPDIGKRIAAKRRIPAAHQC